MKKFVAAAALLFVTVLAIWVAFRLAPETWAVIAGIVFGLVATLPMCAIVLVLLLRGQGRERRPAEPVYYPPQPMAVLDAEPGPYGQYWMEAQAPPVRRLPAHAPPARYRPAPQAMVPARPFIDRAQAPSGYVPAPARYNAAPSWDGSEDYEEWEEAGDVPVDPYGGWERPAPPVRSARILGRQ